MSIALRMSSSVFGAALAAVFFWGYAGLANVGSAGNPMNSGRSEAMFAGPLYLLLLLILAWICKNSKDPRAIAYGIEVWRILKKTGIALLLCVPAAFLFIGFVAPPFIVATSAVYLLMSAINVNPSNGR